MMLNRYQLWEDTERATSDSQYLTVIDGSTQGGFAKGSGPLFSFRVSGLHDRILTAE